MISGDQQQRTGLLGGTFDPVHTGHVAIARQVAAEMSLDRVLFIPAADPPHKKKPGASFRHRVAMLELALSGEQSETRQDCPCPDRATEFSISPIEGELASPSYTVDTLRALKTRMGEQSLFFIIGGDSLLELHLWYRFQELLELTSFIVITRPGITLSALQEAVSRLPGSFAPADTLKLHWRSSADREIHLIVNHITEDIASSEIRCLLQQGLEPDTISSRVLHYIGVHQLYGTKN
jgi:nicotinate-nucleotide adenylyltransferase